LKGSLAAFLSSFVIPKANGYSLKSEQIESPKIRRYRTLGRTGFRVSDIGTGGPWNEGILSATLDAGVNYIDTAEAYHQGHSEIVVGKVLKNRSREKIFVTTKVGLRGNESKANILQRVRKCLERLQTDYIDCLMIWSASSVDIVKYPPFHQAVDQMKMEGKVRHAGISCHGAHWQDNATTMDKILLTAIADGRFDVLLLVYNFMQKKMGETVLNACKEKNIGATIMNTNPVGNYLRAQDRLTSADKTYDWLKDFYTEYMPRFKSQAEDAQKFLDTYNLKNPTEIRDAAITFALSHDGVHTVLGSLDNFETMESFLSLSGRSLTQLEEKRLTLYERGCGQFYCRHACDLCEPQCPHQVPVNTIMRYNYYFDVKKREKYAMEAYAKMDAPKADHCFDCHGPCESVCPYKVPIRGLLCLAHQTLSLYPSV
jgi:predicted aldo/keto reductase-like oxidoreductase